MNSKTLLSVLACVSISGVYAGPCKPLTSQTTQVTSATTGESTLIDLTTTITASDTAAETPSASATELSTHTTKDTTIELTTTTTAAETTSDVSSTIAEEAPTTTEESTTTEASTTTDAFTTTEEATTTTAAATCPTPDSCNNLGLGWAYFSNSAVNNDATYSSFDPTSVKTDSPIYADTTRQIGGLFQSSNGNGNGATGPIYGSPDLPLSYFALNHRGFLYTCDAGTYTFDFPYADDAIFFWIGAKAYSGWTRNNADAFAAFNEPAGTPGSTTFSITLPAQVYIPIRFVYGEANYSGGFKFTITSPSGQILASDSMAASPYLVQNSCDGVVAPAYPPFGSET